MTRLFLECTVRAALIVLGTAIVLYAMRVKVASVKHRVWTAVLLLMLALPFWIVWGPKAPVRILPAKVENFAAEVFIQSPAPVAVKAQQTDSGNVTAAPARRIFSTTEEVLLGLYLFGVLIFLARLAIGTAKARNLVRSSMCVVNPPGVARGAGDPIYNPSVQVGVRSSDSCAAPVTVGCLRPTVILPQHWREWTRRQLDVVLAHEGEHVRRRDPLVQWLALLNRAIFWFHPAAWWLERELSALAEEACDAAVIAQGHDPRDYAETLMKIARDVMDSGSRINSVAVAMPGPRLVERVRKIVAGGSSGRVSGLRAVLSVAACVALGGAFASVNMADSGRRTPQLTSTSAFRVMAMQNQTVTTPRHTSSTLSFDVASLKGRDRNEPVGMIGMQNFPGRLVEACASLNDLVWYAYHVTWARPEGLPDWAKKPCAEGSPEYTYDFQATMPPDTTTDQARQMLQNFLADRFKLTAHWEKRDLPVYALAIAPSGFKVKPWDTKDSARAATIVCPAEDAACHRLVVASVSQLATVLGNTIGRPVLDQTGITGFYFLGLRWAGDMSADSPLPSLAAALHDDFGLELKSEIAPADVLVIDHAEKPTAN